MGGKAFSESERCYSNEVIIIAHAQPQAFLLSNDLQSSFFFSCDFEWTLVTFFGEEVHSISQELDKESTDI